MASSKMTKKTSKSTARGSAGSGSMTSDPRFARLHTDPRFLKPRRDDTKVVIDDRFKDIFTNTGNEKKKDKYGRKHVKGQSDADQMKRFYRLDETNLDADEPADDAGTEGEEKDEVDAEQAIDYARGEGQLESSSEEDSSDEEVEEDSVDSDADDDSEDEDVMVGPSNVTTREKKRQNALRSRSQVKFAEDDEEDDGLGSDLGDIDLDEDVDEAVYAQLDAQARRAIAEGGIEGESEDDQISSSKQKAAQGDRKKKASRRHKSAGETIPTGEDTNRLAVVNLDWDHVRAKDIFKIFSSIVSPFASVSAADALKMTRKSTGKDAPAIAQVRGKILNVRVYPSDFGKERMAREDIEGPPPEIFKGTRSSDAESDEEVTTKNIIQVDEGGEFDEEALRKYQLDRLRYFYAIATFDDKDTARHVYNEVDGTEMERTANVFDLRFVPDAMELPDGENGRDAEYRDQATEDTANYKGLDFKTDALRHSRVKLTWDQDDPERSKLTKLVARGGLSKDQLRDDDFKAYLASDTESEAEDNDAEANPANAGRDRLRALLSMADSEGYGGKGGKRSGGVFDDPAQDDGEQGDMEITFMPGLSEQAARKAGTKKATDDETTLEKYLRKQKEKKERRRSKRNDDDLKDDDEEDEEHRVAKDKPADNASDSNQLGFDDPFFNSDNDIDMDAALAEEYGDSANSKRKDKKDLKAKLKNKTAKAQSNSPEEDARMRAQLTSLIGDTNDEVTQDGRQHFDMKDIIRVESGKDAKRAKLLKKLSKKKQKAEQDFQERKGNPLVQDTFEINAKDERFGALMEDHRFAIDPSHSGFAKTKAMQKIMEERRKQLDRQNGDESRHQGASTRTDDADTEGISSLVAKLKRQNGGTPSSDLPKKKRQRKSKMAATRA